LLAATSDDLRTATHREVDVTFDTAGGVVERWGGGSTWDVVILTSPLLEKLVAAGEVSSATVHRLGRVKVGLAVRENEDALNPVDADSLRQVLLDANAVYAPNMTSSTAGKHFARVLDELGLRQDLADRVREYPNGAQAMAALASSDDRSVGWTQVSEIAESAGVKLAGTLPPDLELVTAYDVAASSSANEPSLAAEASYFLASRATASIRGSLGFEVD
jgi:molybdate transport system substrate-binding protein